MQSGDVVFPSSYAMVVKKVSDFNKETGDVKICITLILRVKITGHVDDKDDEDGVVYFLRNNLRMRINEVEKMVSDLSNKVVHVKSSEAGDGDDLEDKDILQWTIRVEETANVGDGDYDNYPFDTLEAALRIELSHFTLKDGTNYRFDVYRQANEISWKKDADQLAEFGLDYESCTMKYLEEKKPFKSGGKTMNEFYYPGATFTVKLPRNAWQPSLQFYMPTIVLSIFICTANSIMPEGGFADMLLTVSLSLLTLIGLYIQIRDAIPPTLSITFIEKIVMVYVFYSLVPVVDCTLNPDDPLFSGWWGYMVWLTMATVITAIYGYRFYHQYYASLDRDPPVQQKMAGDKKAPDLMWTTPLDNVKD